MRLSILVSGLSVIIVLHSLISSVFKIILHIAVHLFFIVPGRREETVPCYSILGEAEV